MNEMDEIISGLKEEILKLITRHRGGVSFVELCDEIEGLRGDFIWHNEFNIVLWAGLSKEGIDACAQLVVEKKINSYSDSSSFLCYLIDGKALKYPLAKRKNHVYKKLHWRPCMFGTYEYVEGL